MVILTMKVLSKNFLQFIINGDGDVDCFLRSQEVITKKVNRDTPLSKLQHKRDDFSRKNNQKIV